MANISVSGTSALSLIESYLSALSLIESCLDEQIEKRIAELQDCLRDVPLAILQKMSDLGEPNQPSWNTASVISLSTAAGANQAITVLEKIDSNKPEELKILSIAIDRVRAERLQATEAKDNSMDRN